MAQISRPFQIALAAVALLALVWVVALRGHTSPESSGSTAVAPAATAAQSSSGAPAANPATPTSEYKGSAPGVGGLTRAIAKAHGAVAASQQNAKSLETKSAQASSTAAASSSAAAPATKAAAGAAAKPAAHAPAAGHPVKHLLAAAGQRSIEAELKRGSVVVLLVWNPKGVADQIVHADLMRLLAVHHRFAHAKRPQGSKPNGLHMELEQPISVRLATPAQVASFGSFTRDVQIFGTPSTLVINSKGQVRALPGVPGILSIEQATDEARHP
jgi:hypothetical protein